MSPRFITQTTFLFTVALGSLSLFGCDDQPPDNPKKATITTTLSLRGLEPLTDGSLYKVSLVINNSPVTVGSFNMRDGTMVTPDGITSSGAFSIVGPLHDISMMMITVDSSGDPVLTGGLPGVLYIPSTTVQLSAPGASAEADGGTTGPSGSATVVAYPIRETSS